MCNGRTSVAFGRYVDSMTSRKCRRGRARRRILKIKFLLNFRIRLPAAKHTFYEIETLIGSPSGGRSYARRPELHNELLTTRRPSMGYRAPSTGAAPARGARAAHSDRTVPVLWTARVASEA
ncbi:hypothetical protein EVAR_21367_1 [Eumeta japonica]|uniref:Uncharacterized protein n=1 Tax=Eumeta variegata TaxID=151549 RepID=A0A4C1YAS0_EUMVA|nr:hypothetical protein EVAR_21367_1 [Eumeta japonica]